MSENLKTWTPQLSVSSFTIYLNIHSPSHNRKHIFCLRVNIKECMKKCQHVVPKNYYYLLNSSQFIINGLYNKPLHKPADRKRKNYIVAYL